MSVETDTLTDTSRKEAIVNDPSDSPVLTAPMTVEEVGVFCGLNWRAAKAFCLNAGGIRCGSLWQLPVERMPVSYHLSRGLPVPIPADVCDTAGSSGACLLSEDNSDMQQLLTERDAAVMLRVSLSDLSVMLESGQLPYSAICGHIRIDHRDIAEAVQRLRINQQSLPRRNQNTCQL